MTISLFPIFIRILKHEVEVYICVKVIKNGTKSAKPVHETYCGNNMRKQESIKLWQSAENPIDLEQEKGTRLISRLLSSLDKIDLIS